MNHSIEIKPMQHMQMKNTDAQILLSHKYHHKQQILWGDGRGEKQ
jgi:hypothetical protein